jgi:selenide,water dikinase
MNLVLLGGGHAHLRLLEKLATTQRAGTSITLVSPHPRQLYSGMVPGWVAGRHRLDDCAISLTRLAARAHIAFHRSAAAALDLGRREVVCADARRLPFDLLSIDVGPEPDVSTIAGADGATSIRPIEGFVAAWPGIVARWKAGAVPFELVIVGGGAAATELAFAIQARAARERASVRIRMVGPETFPFEQAGAAVGREVLDLFAARGIGWDGDRGAQRIDAGSVVVDRGPALRFDACVLATGAAAPNWPAQAGLAVDERGFIQVDAALRSTSHPGVFAAGDIAAYAEARPKSGVFAVRAGAVLADNVLAAARGRTLRRWRAPQRALYLLATGDGGAIASYGGLHARGAWLGRLKDRIDRRYVARYGG